MKKPCILIVEDEVLIAHTIKRYLEKNDYEVAGMVISYEEAVLLIEQGQVDLALLDIRLNGEKSGIDVGQYLYKHHPGIPFIYLTSQVDKRHIDAAKNTHPAGYLSKPIQKESLKATIAIALHNHQTEESILLQVGAEKMIVPIARILYLESDHVYVKVVTKNHHQPLLIRQSLKEMVNRLPANQFLQTHRSYVINCKEVSNWNRNQVFIGDIVIPVSRSKKEEVFSRLEQAE